MEKGNKQLKKKTKNVYKVKSDLKEDERKINKGLINQQKELIEDGNNAEKTNSHQQLIGHYLFISFPSLFYIPLIPPLFISVLYSHILCSLLIVYICIKVLDFALQTLLLLQ